MTLEFTRTEHPHPVSEGRRAEILAAPGFGNHFTDYMVVVDYDRERGWHDAKVTPYGPIALDPAAMVLHYAQEIFEGLKAYRQPDGTIAAFRPEANAERFNTSARRLAMPEFPVEDFVGSLRALLAVAFINTDSGVKKGATVVVDVRGRALECEVVLPPFVQGNV